MNNSYKPIHHQAGQALTEFNITAMFLLVPLFLIIPLVGKYIDIRHSSVQTARNMAWERTVWYEQASWPYAAGRAQFKSEQEIEQAIMRRNLSASNTPFARNDWNRALDDEAIKPLWKDHSGNQLLSAQPVTEGVDLRPQGNTREEAYSYVAVDALGEFEDVINGGIDSINNAVSGAGSEIGVTLPRVGHIGVFSKINRKGLYQPQVRIPVNNIEKLARFGSSGVAPLEDINLVMHGNAAILTDTWAAKDDAQFQAWSEDITVTHLFKPFFDPVQDAINWFEIPILGIKLAPRTDRRYLHFGEVDTGPVPPSSKEPDCPGGLCSYE